MKKEGLIQNDPRPYTAIALQQVEPIIRTNLEYIQGRYLINFNLEILVFDFLTSQ